jgi:chromosome partitioning protein
MTQPELNRSALTRVIAVEQGKGGVGKTSVTCNLAGLTALAGYPTLVIDFDPQGNVGDDLGYEGDHGKSLRNAIITESPLNPIKNVRPNLDVVPGGDMVADLPALVQSRRDRGDNDESAIQALAFSLAPIADSYDFIWIDCPPGEKTLQLMALAAARWVLVPTHTDVSSRKGLRKVADRFGDLRTRGTNEYLDLLGVVLTHVTTAATRVRAEARDAIVEDLGGDPSLLLDTTIRFAEASANRARNTGRLAHELEAAAGQDEPWWKAIREGRAPQPRVPESASNLAGDYEALAREVLERIAVAEADEDETEPGDDVTAGKLEEVQA